MVKIKTHFLLLLICIHVLQTLGAEGLTLVRDNKIPRGDFVVQAELPLPEELRSFLIGLNAEEIPWFLNNGELIHMHAKVLNPQLIINDEDLAHKLFLRHEENGNNLAIELLMALKVPLSIEQSLSEEALDLHIFNVLHRVSTLTGLEYFSPSRKKMRIFYISSNIVDEHDAKTVLADPIFPHLLPSNSFVARLHDSSFGNGLYNVQISPEALIIENISPINYGILKIMNPEEFGLQIRIQRHEGNLFFYALSSMYVPNIFGLHERVRNSFYNRILALYTWFAREMSTLNT